jgi:hypothetical protein
MAIESIERIAQVPGNKPVRFAVQVVSRDQAHTHGEMTRAPKDRIREALVRAANEIEAILADVGRTPESKNQAWKCTVAIRRTFTHERSRDDSR